MSKSMFFITIVMFQLVMFTVNITIKEAIAYGNLKDKIQEELTVNPFLKKYGMKLKVTEETEGYVTIDLYEGNRKLRERIHSGADILTYQIENLMGMKRITKEEKESVTVLRKTLGVIKEMHGVKEIMLTASINTINDRQEDKTKRDEINAQKEKESQEYINQLKTSSIEWIQELLQNPIKLGVGIAGIKIGDFKEDVVMKFGKPEGSKDRYLYSYDKFALVIRTNKDGSIWGISLQDYDSKRCRKIAFFENTEVCIGSNIQDLEKEIGSPIMASNQSGDQKINFYDGGFMIYDVKSGNINSINICTGKHLEEWMDAFRPK